MALSEKEMLLLDEFMYSDLAPQGKKMTLMEITEAYVDSSGEVSSKLIQAEIDAKSLKVSGDLPGNTEYLADVMSQIRADPALSNLVVYDTTVEVEGGIRAACFVDSNDQATVAFRGTGGSYQQWRNNFEGYGDVSQQSERDAAAFISGLPYNNITVTGHSNGGNQAMYVSVVCGDKVAKCVSFEGQGVSNEFISRYSGEIADNQYKIKNICAEKDFVSPLLKDIAGETVYVKSDSKLLCFSHGGYGILSAAEKNGSFDGNGNFTEDAYVEQSPQAKAIHLFTGIFSDMSQVPVIGPKLEVVFDILGNIVGLIISKKLDLFKLWDPEVAGTYKKIIDDTAKTLKEYARESNPGVMQLIDDGMNALREWSEAAYGGLPSWLEKTFGGGASSAKAGNSGGKAGGGADVIRVSTGEMAVAVGRYQAEKARLMDALRVCNSAASLLAQSWAGPSFAALSVKLSATYENLSRSIDRADDAIDELKAVIGIMDRAENSVASVSAALDTGTSPFG